TVPTDPKHSRSYHAKNHAVRRHDFLSKTEPRPEQSAKDERRPTGRHVNYGAAGKIDCRNFRPRIPNPVHPSIDPPDHVSERKINDEHPNTDENEHRCKSDS